MSGLLKLVTLLLLPITFFPSAASSAINIPQLESSTDVATAGFYTLSWISDSPENELQQSVTEDFQQTRAVYTGPDTATVISGLPDGVRYYRVRAIDMGQVGPWSEPVQVIVQHHALGKAVFFLITGMVVFVATVLLIASGARTHRG